MKNHHSVFLAGGYIRACVANEPVADIDLFAPDEERASLYARVLAGDEKISKSKNAFTFRIKGFDTPIQVIHRWTFAKPEEVIESFDFTVAKAMVWCSSGSVDHTRKWESLIHDDFYSDLAAKRLVYTSPIRNEDAGGSVLRLLKFYSKGYRTPLDSLAAVIARLVVQGVVEEGLSKLGPTREEAMTVALTGLLHEVDPLLDPEHIYHLPSTITDAAPTE
jgi:hypothetical protein